jgi:hypothetical protein
MAVPQVRPISLVALRPSLLNEHQCAQVPKEFLMVCLSELNPCDAPYPDFESYKTAHFAVSPHHPASPLFKIDHVHEFVVDVLTSCSRATESWGVAYKIASQEIHNQLAANVKDQAIIAETLNSLQLIGLHPEIKVNAPFPSVSWREKFSKSVKIDGSFDVLNALCRNRQPTVTDPQHAIFFEIVWHQYAVHMNLHRLFGEHPHGFHDRQKLSSAAMHALLIKFWTH